MSNNNIINALFNPDDTNERMAIINKSYRVALWASVTQNIAVVAAFLILAIACKQWWIILFSIFFMRNYTKTDNSGSGKKKEEKNHD